MGSPFPLAADRLAAFAHGRDRLSRAEQVRVGLCFDFGGADAWRRLADLVPDPEAAETADPVVAALRTLLRRDPRPLDAVHRRAVQEASGQSLGFLRLVVEEARVASRRQWPSQGPLDAVRQLLDHPAWQRHGAVAVFGRPLVALRARALLYLAGHHALLGQQAEHERALRLGSVLLHRAGGAGGGQGAELLACACEAQADLALYLDQPDEALERLREARELVRGYVPVDRQVQVLLRLGIVLADLDAEGATADLDEAVRLMASLPADVHPRLQLRARHYAAAAWLQRAQQGIAEQQPFRAFQQGDLQAPWLELARLGPQLGELATLYRQQAATLARAREHLRACEPFLGEASATLALEHRWYVAMASVLGQPEAALRELDRALAGFEALGDGARCRRLATDAFHALALLAEPTAGAGWLTRLAHRLESQTPILERLIGYVDEALGNARQAETPQEPPTLH